MATKRISITTANREEQVKSKIKNPNSTASTVNFPPLLLSFINKGWGRRGAQNIDEVTPTHDSQPPVDL
ncbi:MAG: hypothetical protein DRJ31_10265 [Candidatus Methanomethylicota archaeon]|uniref:Uncharacterized protein n=1 Tax=Thermoproteota archaeon TaxID=2056631 RepID=A0A497EKS8_9CREN|nr:MAG: hypothetical protein DRJ31_10265 [Candidatus Verstraetearchaeota archaeon]